jgi:hypothetical protein
MPFAALAAAAGGAGYYFYSQNAVGLYKLNSVDDPELESAWLQPLSL